MYDHLGYERARRSLRMADRDYADAGVYFVTIRAQGEIRFGELAPDSVALNDAGLMIGLEWTALRERFKTIALDAFIVMPDHFHGIVVLRDPTTLTHEPRPIGQRQCAQRAPGPYMMRNRRSWKNQGSAASFRLSNR